MIEIMVAGYAVEFTAIQAGGQLTGSSDLPPPLFLVNSRIDSTAAASLQLPETKVRKEKVQFLDYKTYMRKSVLLALTSMLSHSQPTIIIVPSLGQCHFRSQETDSNSLHQTFGEDQRQ